MNTEKIRARIQDEVRAILAAGITPRAVRSLAFLSTVYRNMGTRVYRNKRGLYYDSVETFGSQQTVNTLIKKYTRRLGCGMDELFIRASLKGLFSGHLTFVAADSTFGLCGKNLIPEMSGIVAVRHSVQRVLVVEKDTVFSSVEDPSLIVVCGRGYPCANTLRLLSLLAQTADLFCMTDLDPYGLHIFTVYRRHIKGMRRIGLCRSDLFRYKVDRSQCTRLNRHDTRMIERLLEHEAQRPGTPLLGDIRLVEGLGLKLELEAITSRDGFAIAEYLEDHTTQ